MSNDANLNKDPRGPERTIKDVKYTPKGALITLSCGHVRNFNAIFSYHIGDPARCFACREIELSS